MNKQEQMIVDLGEHLSKKISDAFRQAIQLTDNPKDTFSVCAFGFAAAMGATAAVYNDLLGGAESANPIDVAAAMMKFIERAERKAKAKGHRDQPQ